MVLQTNGPVLEMGCGWGSTPLLHMLCAPGRRLLTVETTPAWLDRFKDLGGGYHELLLVPAYEGNHEFYEEPWSIAFVDQDPESHRWASVRRLRGHADYILFHDIEQHEHLAQLGRLASNGEAFRHVEICRMDGTTSCLGILTDLDTIPGRSK